MNVDADVRYAISTYDLAKLDICKGGGCSQLGDKELLNVLYESGMDITKPITYLVGEHRPKSSNAIVEAGYWEGYERTDQRWLKSGAASIEVILETTDPALRQEMRDLMRTASTNTFKK